MYKEILANFIDLLFPRSCSACGEVLISYERYLCTACLAMLPHASSDLMGEGNGILRKFCGKTLIYEATALFKFTKKSNVQALMHKIKYAKQPELAQVLGAYHGRLLKKANGCDMVVPVPLHPSRYRQRGYNQSAFFARGLASVLNIPYFEDVLIRKLSSVSQTKKARLDRWKNVGGAFVVADEDWVKGKQVLLVDDVITTGATLTACAQALVDVGVKKISVATIALAQ